MLAVCMPLLMAALLLLTRQIERRANFWLALLLLAGLIAQVPQIIGFANAYDVWPGLTFAPFNVELYIGPLIYLHAYRLMEDRPLGWRKWLIVPGLLQTAYYVWAFTMLGDYKAKWAYTRAAHSPYIQPVETLLGIAFIVIAILAAFRLMRRLIFAGLEIVPFFIEDVSYIAEFPAQLLLTAITAWFGFEAVARTNKEFPKMPAHGGASRAR